MGIICSHLERKWRKRLCTRERRKETVPIVQLGANRIFSISFNKRFLSNENQPLCFVSAIAFRAASLMLLISLFLLGRELVATSASLLQGQAQVFTITQVLSCAECQKVTFLDKKSLQTRANTPRHTAGASSRRSGKVHSTHTHIAWKHAEAIGNESRWGENFFPQKPNPTPNVNLFFIPANFALGSCARERPPFPRCNAGSLSYRRINGYSAFPVEAGWWWKTDVLFLLLSSPCSIVLYCFISLPPVKVVSFLLHRTHCSVFLKFDLLMHGRADCSCLCLYQSRRLLLPNLYVNIRVCQHCPCVYVLVFATHCVLCSESEGAATALEHRIGSECLRVFQFPVGKFWEPARAATAAGGKLKFMKLFSFPLHYVFRFVRWCVLSLSQQGRKLCRFYRCRCFVVVFLLCAFILSSVDRD